MEPLHTDVLLATVPPTDPAITVMKFVLVNVLLPPLLVAVKVTLKVPAVLYVIVGF